MPYYIIQRTRRYEQDYQDNHSAPHKLHILNANNEHDARQILAACCGMQYNRKTPINQTEHIDCVFNNREYFKCKEISIDEIHTIFNKELEAAGIRNNPPEVLYPVVDEHYWNMRPQKHRGHE